MELPKVKRDEQGRPQLAVGIEGHWGEYASPRVIGRVGADQLVVTQSSLGLAWLTIDVERGAHHEITDLLKFTLSIADRDGVVYERAAQMSAHELWLLILEEPYFYVDYPALAESKVPIAEKLHVWSETREQRAFLVVSKHGERDEQIVVFRQREKILNTTVELFLGQRVRPTSRHELFAQVNLRVSSSTAMNVHGDPLPMPYDGYSTDELGLLQKPLEIGRLVSHVLSPPFDSRFRRLDPTVFNDFVRTDRRDKPNPAVYVRPAR